MKTRIQSRPAFEFYFRDLDTLVRVEDHADEVIIRATRDNVSERRKRFFIHELAAEGYIPDQYEWFSEPATTAGHGVKWVIDYSWLSISPELTRRTNRFMYRLILGSVVLWLALMVFFFRSTG